MILLPLTLALLAPTADAPDAEAAFLRPAAAGPAEPQWGLRGGIAVGLSPLPGPRGLIRIYTPYLGQPDRTVMNFVAIEPVVAGRRGFSELETSSRDGRPGLTMWSTDTGNDGEPPRSPDRPARGVLGRDGAAHTLTVYLHVERFANGARPFVKVTLRTDRPHEVAFETYAAPGGAPMSRCILTATMGNYARLRRLYLRDRIVSAASLYRPDAPLDRLGFYPHRQWPLDDLIVRDGDALLTAAPDEPDPAAATYDPATRLHWRYAGVPAAQAWIAPAEPGLVARVNARRAYWMSRAAIPGGVAFENVELDAPFRPGRVRRLRITPIMDPADPTRP